MSTHRLTPHEERTIAAAAVCDPRSVRKCLSGGILASITLARIKRALSDMGRHDLLAILGAPASNGNTASPPPQAA
jgi:hypothetical protein